MKNFDSIIIGFGKGGKTLAATLAKRGEKVAVIEKSRKMYGGTCINIGCIPSKKLLTLSQENISKTPEFYKNAISEKNSLIQTLREKNFSMLNDLENIDIFDGEASFISEREVKVGEHILAGEKIFINTGAKSMIPDIKGISNSKNVYTSTSLMDLAELPKDLIIIGAGFIGLEFASIYTDFSSKVTIVNKHSNILQDQDEEIVSEIVKDFENRGIVFENNAEIVEIFDKDKKVFLKISQNGQEKILQADAVLLATGRKPNTKGLNLENAGVELTEKGAVKVDDRLQTSTKNIFAMGDVTGGPQFTYISLDDFRIIIDNLFGDKKRNTSDRTTFAYSSFLNPPFSRIGMTEKEAREKGKNIKVGKIFATNIPKAKILKNTNGLLKAVVDEDTGLILGASLYCVESQEIINIISLAMKHNLPYTALRDHIFTHPTVAEVLNDLFKI
ncbi:pyridine nucleotide-disulfide oxidoreductase [Candidatus Gracilibacteria bacterium HOT-871]|nr:pyridine nucleotide-disulfide oxidoreductase [Candidatus Gracilibacteria bacterium HOT-871]